MAPKRTTTATTAASKARPARAAASKPAAPTSTASASKANGKKRAAADEAESTTPPAKKTTTAKARSKKLASAQEQDAGDVNEREIIASLSDISADSSDDDGDDDDDDASDVEEPVDSSDEDDEDDLLAQTTQPRSSLASVKLPNSKDDAVVKARLDKLRASKSTSSSSSTTPGVLYIGRLPKGFFEKQLRSYFTQFGDVTRLRVSRNKKTGASKHYAFVEFADRDVAKIVQETMHNYLIDGRLLQVKEVAKDKVHPELWVGANRKFQKVPGARLERVVRSRVKTDEEQQTTNERVIKRQDERRERLKKLGIEYDFEGYTRDGEEDKAKKSKGPATAAAAASAAGKPKSTPVKAAKGKTAKA